MSKDTGPEKDAPPILKRWSRLYMAVMLNLVFWLLLFYVCRMVFE